MTKYKNLYIMNFKEIFANFTMRQGSVAQPFTLNQARSQHGANGAIAPPQLALEKTIRYYILNLNIDF